MPDTKKLKPDSKIQLQPQPKELYLAKGLCQLNLQVDDKVTRVKAANFESLCSSADKLWATLNVPNEHDHLDQDQERAYIFLLCFIRVLRRIETRTGDKKFVYARFGSKLENSVNRWEFLRGSLVKRYAARLRPTDIATSMSESAMTTTITEAPGMDAIIAHSLEKLKDKPPVSPEFQFMAKYLCDGKSTDPKCLYQLLQDKVNVLIVDIRSKDAYGDSRIKCNAAMINIDGDIIRKGMSANKLEKMLSDDIRQIFENRKKYELLVALDENSFPMSHIHAIEKNKIYTFLDIINNWDLDIDRYPNGGPVMLQGGFAGWLDHYPAQCVNPQARFSSHAPEHMDTFLAFDYPAFNYDPVKKKVVVIDRSTKPIYPPTKKTKVDPDTDLESDSDEVPYRDEMQLDPEQLNDEDALRNCLAHIAVAMRAAAKLRVITLRSCIEFRVTYDAMSADERQAAGDAQMRDCMDALNAASVKLEQLGKRRDDYVDRFPILANDATYTQPPHGPITARADHVLEALTARYSTMLTENRDTIAYIHDVLKSSVSAASNDSGVSSSASIPSIITPPPPKIATVPKIPDRTLQPAAIWLPQFNSVSETVTGLVNYHNNCFLNATVQALRHVPTFYKYILNRDYKEDMRLSKKHQKVQLLPQLAKAVEDLWRCSQNYISAEKLYKTMLETCPIFEDWRHEDGLEAFTLVFNRICEETERPMNIHAQYEFYRSDKIEHWIRMHNGQISYLSQRFYYEIKRTRDCKMCNRKMITYDISNSMMLPLKLPNESGGMYTPARLDLQDAVTAYMELPDRYKILCTKCKRMAIEYKKIKYYPEVAVINLKRYVNAGETADGGKPSFYRSDRIVSYPENKLKIGIAHYRLNAVVCHSGTMESGHYTAFCLNPADKKWYYYDDGAVTQLADIHGESFRRKCYVFYYSLETEFQRLNRNYVKL